MVVLDSVLHLWASHLFDWYWNWFLDLDVLGFSQGASWLYLLYFLSKLGPAGSVYILGGNSVWGPFTWKRLQYLCWVKVLFIYLILEFIRWNKLLAIFISSSTGSLKEATEGRAERVPIRLAFFMAELKEPLVTLALIVGILLFEIKPRILQFFFPSISDVSCATMEGMGVKQWLMLLFYHVNKGHLAYDILSILWKGVLLEGCIGSKQFVLMVLTLVAISHGLLILAVELWRLLDVADICFPLCQVGLTGLQFALSFILTTNYEMYRSVIAFPCQNLYRVIVSAIYSVEISFVYFLCPLLPISGPVCGTVAGFLYSRGPQLYRNLNSWFFLLPKDMRAADSEQLTETINMVWRCRACTYDSSVTTSPYVCAMCETPKFEFIGSPEVQVHPHVAGLVWNCARCTYENGVFFHRCEICGTNRPVNWLGKGFYNNIPVIWPCMRILIVVLSKSVKLDILPFLNV